MTWGSRSARSRPGRCGRCRRAPELRAVARLAHQPVLVRESDELHPRRETQLGQDAAHVALHGGFADESHLAGFGIAQPARREQEDLLLPRGQRLERIRRRPPLLAHPAEAAPPPATPKPPIAATVRVSFGAITECPACTVRMAASTNSGVVSFITKPWAPARMARATASSRWKVVSTMTLGAVRTDRLPAMIRAVASIPSSRACGCPSA